jgi:Ca2+-binding EF-hand superfamily protein
VFADHDADNSGELTASELQVMLTDLGIECDEIKLNEIMQEVDADGSGAVGYAEFVKWWSTFDTKLAFSKYDADNSVISSE